MTGCAGSLSGAAAKPMDAGLREQATLRIGATAVVDSHLSPLVPVHLSGNGSGVSVTFGERGKVQATAQLDPVTLQVMSTEKAGASEPRQQPEWTAKRVPLEGGRFLVCWTERDADGSSRAMARLWAADGHALGPAVRISPADADVLGAPRAASTDGRHTVVTFASSSGGPFELRAVSLEDTTQAAKDLATASR
jgi:hypothetical protein